MTGGGMRWALLEYIMLRLEAFPGRFFFLVHHHSINKQRYKQSIEDYLSTQPPFRPSQLFKILPVSYHQDLNSISYSTPTNSSFQQLLNMSATTVTRTATAAVRRPGFFMQVRRMGRSFEHQPFERLSATMKPARPDYAKQVIWTAGKFVTYAHHQSNSLHPNV